MKHRKSGFWPKFFALVLVLFISSVAMAQTEVKGLVKDDMGEPLPGAKVATKAGDAATVTDFNGNFTIKAQKGSTLVVSYMGFVTKEVTASANVVVTLSEDAKALEDVVVIGYGTAKKNDLTGSVTVMKPDEENRGVITSAQDMMVGKVAGVSVTTSGGPGAGATIRIRGGSSLNASNDPLIVIDGLAMDNNGVKGLSNLLSMVNPQDIESFTVLKDASATAIYGSRGSNGVIIITTKKGDQGHSPRVSYTGNVNFATRKNPIEVMSGDQFRDYLQQTYGADKYNQWRAQGWVGDANTDWQSEIYRTGVSSDHAITLSGGLKHMPYRVTVGYTGNRGILKTTDFRRTTASVNLNPSLADDHLKINLNGKFLFAESRYANQEAISAAIAMNPTIPVKSSNPIHQQYFQGYWQWDVAGNYGDGSAWPYSFNNNGTKNPVSLLDLKRDEAQSMAFVGNAEFDYAVHHFEDLHLHLNMGGDYSTGQQDSYTSPYSPESFYYGWQGWEKINKYNLQLNAYAQYTHNWNNRHDLSVMAGYEWQHFHRELTRDGSGYYPETIAGHVAGEAYNRSNSPWATENYLVSFFGRAGYTLFDRYMLTATVRRDGSSRFRDHWSTFPSFAFAWRINEEKFLRDCRNLNMLKLRLGYGLTGQQDINQDYGYVATYSQNQGAGSNYFPCVDANGKIMRDAQGNIIYMPVSRPGEYNAALKWETTTTYNAGIDLGLWNNRLSASIDYYYRVTTDLINRVSVPAGTNFKNMVTSNIGSMVNQGVELQLNAVAIDTKDWTWDLAFNATYNRNEITELIGGDETYMVETGGISAGTGRCVQMHAVGHPMSSFYVYQQVYDAKGMPIEGVYVDRDGNGIINESDRYFYKSPVAPWTFGFSSKLRYKQWDLGFGLRASLGNYVFNDVEAGWSNIKTIYDEKGYLTNRPLYELPKAWQTWDNPISDYFVHNGSFLKCDNITLGYSWPGVTRHKISGRVFASVSNVFCITKYNGIDPEVFGGIDGTLYPRPITYQLGVNLNF
ncbi:MAG: TonB-dependent receptor [Bacteroidaceae bacterium]|nr:TonB-dependent receptor [Bacteroidaceae bacterium]